ncbi:hypothetical protein ASPFODRAFT_61253 [Aspergillus luchuensis CBS 106.47]|uniref:Uncharacterized protein n=1 Tax=Aspergillus luchuensis (strain CBS 106.47) TaxID=1137211 RepID=A0A1M3TGT7_ASPLC|nr:hypothetical protein ASPFODRAFT_61253 [Aspergillus luchuensis CBS 106.47]
MQANPPEQEKENSEKSSAKKLGKVERFQLPSSPEEWQDLVENAKLEALTIKTLPTEMFGSASQASDKQYLMLRCYSPKIVHPTEFSNHMSKFGFCKNMLRDATSLLDQSRDWAGYIRTLQKHISIRELRESHAHLWPGPFMAAKRLQEQTATVQGTHDLYSHTNNQKSEKCRDAEDEATPNAALIVLLQEITHIVERTDFEWVLNRAGFLADFGDGRRYRAFTDGVLRSTSDFKVFSITEVKKAFRSHHVIIQEACEIAALMMTSPESAVFEDHFLLISQDRHQIFLTFVKYEKELENYYRNNEACDKFLILETFGPYDAEDPGCVVELAKVIIAAIWIVKRSLSSGAVLHNQT